MFQCVSVPGLGFRRGSYKCQCRDGYYYPEPGPQRYYNGTVIEDEYEKKLQVKSSGHIVRSLKSTVKIPWHRKVTHLLGTSWYRVNMFGLL